MLLHDHLSIRQGYTASMFLNDWNCPWCSKMRKLRVCNKHTFKNKLHLCQDFVKMCFCAKCTKYSLPLTFRGPTRFLMLWLDSCIFEVLHLAWDFSELFSNRYAEQISADEKSILGQNTKCYTNAQSKNYKLTHWTKNIDNQVRFAFWDQIMLYVVVQKEKESHVIFSQSLSTQQ